MDEAVAARPGAPPRPLVREGSLRLPGVQARPVEVVRDPHRPMQGSGVEHGEEEEVEGADRVLRQAVAGVGLHEGEDLQGCDRAEVRHSVALLQDSGAAQRGEGVQRQDGVRGGDERAEVLRGDRGREGGRGQGRAGDDQQQVAHQVEAHQREPPGVRPRARAGARGHRSRRGDESEQPGGQGEAEVRRVDGPLRHLGGRVARGDQLRPADDGDEDGDEGGREDEDAPQLQRVGAEVPRAHQSK